MTDKNAVTIDLPTINKSHITTSCLLCGGPIPVFSKYYEDVTRVCDKCKQKWAELDKLIVIFNSKKELSE